VRGVPPSDALIPAWLSRAGTLLLLAVVGSVAAWVAVWCLVVLGVFGLGGDDLLVGYIVNLPLVAKLSCACGLVVGVAGASARTWSATLRRAGIAALVLLVIGAGTMAGLAAIPGPEFDGARFRAAAASGDVDEVERQAHRAVEQDVVVGLSRSEARQLVGEPERISGTGHVWSWDAGMINDVLGPGDGGRFYVIFDQSGRVESAKIDTGL
jgi:hypothetical protein